MGVRGCNQTRSTGTQLWEYGDEHALVVGTIATFDSTQTAEVIFEGLISFWSFYYLKMVYIADFTKVPLSQT